jgi:hypothetical protein
VKESEVSSVYVSNPSQRRVLRQVMRTARVSSRIWIREADAGRRCNSFRARAMESPVLLSAAGRHKWRGGVWALWPLLLKGGLITAGGGGRRGSTAGKRRGRGGGGSNSGHNSGILAIIIDKWENAS